MRPLLKTLQRPLVYRGAIALYVVMMLGLITTSVAIGNRDVRSALYLTGSSIWKTNQPQALRALYFDAATGFNLSPDTFELQWNAPNTPPLTTAEAGPGHYLHIHVPAYDRLAPDPNDTSYGALAPDHGDTSYGALAPDHGALAPDPGDSS